MSPWSHSAIVASGKFKANGRMLHTTPQLVIPIAQGKAVVWTDTEEIGKASQGASETVRRFSFDHANNWYAVTRCVRPMNLRFNDVGVRLQRSIRSWRSFSTQTIVD